MNNFSKELDLEIQKINLKIKGNQELNDREMHIMILSGLLSEEENE